MCAFVHRLAWLLLRELSGCAGVRRVVGAQIHCIWVVVCGSVDSNACSRGCAVQVNGIKCVNLPQNMYECLTSDGRVVSCSEQGVVSSTMREFLFPPESSSGCDRYVDCWLLAVPSCRREACLRIAWDVCKLVSFYAPPAFPLRFVRFAAACLVRRRPTPS
jgi:hypothetical protein